MEKYDALHKAEQTAWSRTSAYAVFKDGTHVGTIKIAHPEDGAGILRAFLFDFSTELQMGTANGGGYDKETAALCGLKFHGLTFGDHPRNGFKQMLRDAGFALIQIV